MYSSPIAEVVLIKGTIQGQELTIIQELSHLITWKHETRPKIKAVFATIHQTLSTQKIKNYTRDLAESLIQSYLLHDDEFLPVHMFNG